MKRGKKRKRKSCFLFTKFDQFRESRERLSGSLMSLVLLYDSSHQLKVHSGAMDWHQKKNMKVHASFGLGVLEEKGNLSFSCALSGYASST
jgi:hypothetical protein